MEQFGTPEEVYTRPATTFVASFMGSPPMNLLKNGPNAALGGPSGALMGIRPEHLQITPSGWALQVETLEMLGAERLVYCRMGGEPLIVRTDESQAAPAIGATVHVTPRFDRLHWFDAASGQRL
jgi:sn-glycerol 3-phosphate transport system ATP-binding protein